MRALGAALIVLALVVPFQAQSRVDIGTHAAGDRDRAYKDQSVGLSGHLLFRFGQTALDATADWTFRAPKTGASAPDGKTITTTFLMRRYLSKGLYVVAGVDVNKLSSVLLDTTATFAATGVGIELGNVRLQVAYEPPDFSSGQTLSHYRIEAEYLRRLSKDYYLSIRPQATVIRFGRPEGAGTLTAERAGVTVSVGRSF